MDEKFRFRSNNKRGDPLSGENSFLSLEEKTFKDREANLLMSEFKGWSELNFDYSNPISREFISNTHRWLTVFVNFFRGIEEYNDTDLFNLYEYKRGGIVPEISSQEAHLTISGTRLKEILRNEFKRKIKEIKNFGKEKGKIDFDFTVHNEDKVYYFCLPVPK